MNLIKKENLKPVLVLTLICLICGLLLAGVNAITAPFIDAANKSAIRDSLQKVMADGEFNDSPDSLSGEIPAVIKEIYTEKNGKGKVVIVSTNKGYTGKDIGFSVAIDNEGKIINLVITKNEESIVPALLKPNGSYGESYKGVSADGIDKVVTGATVKFTEKAIKDALKDVFVYLDFADPNAEKPLPRTDDELVTLAYEFMGGTSISFTDVTPEETTYAKRVYRENSGKGYVVYALVISPDYGTTEIEAMLHINNEGKVLKIGKLYWKVSDPADYGTVSFTPPEAAEVDSFFGRFENVTSETVGSVEVLSGVTNTSNRLIAAVTESISVVKARAVRDVAKSDEEIIALAKELVGADSEFTNLTPGNIENVQRVYRENSGKGYVVYTLAISPNYGTPETETLIYINNEGKVAGLKKLYWKVSDPADYGTVSFTPPEAAEVDSFFGRFKNVTSETVGSVEALSGVTQTSNRLKAAFAEAFQVVSDLKAIEDNIISNSQNGGNN